MSIENKMRTIIYLTSFENLIYVQQLIDNYGLPDVILSCPCSKSVSILNKYVDHFGLHKSIVIKDKELRAKKTSIVSTLLESYTGMVIWLIVHTNMKFVDLHNYIIINGNEPYCSKDKTISIIRDELLYYGLYHSINSDNATVTIDLLDFFDIVQRMTLKLATTCMVVRRQDVSTLFVDSVTLVGHRNQCTNVIMYNSDSMFKYLARYSVYINLECRNDRRRNFEKEMKTIGIDPVTRFSAISWTPGCIGCTKSHCEVLENAIRRKFPLLWIFEDDFEWTKDYIYIDTLLASFIQSFKSNWDVLIVASVPYGLKTTPCSVEGIKKTTRSQTTTSYIVNGTYMIELLKNFRESEHLLLHNEHKSINTYAIDQNWHKLQEKDRWYLTYPGLGKQAPGESTIEGKYVNYSFI